MRSQSIISGWMGEKFVALAVIAGHAALVVATDLDTCSGADPETCVTQSSTPAGSMVQDKLKQNVAAQASTASNSMMQLAVASARATITTAESTASQTTTTLSGYPYSKMTCSGMQTLTTASMSYTDYDNIVTAVQTQFNSLPTTCNATYCPQADWAGCVLRMTGHDFMDYVSGSGGGSDGCIDFSDGDNAGLAPCLYDGEFGFSLAQSYASFCTSISLADFIVIAGEAVINVTRNLVVTANASRPTLDLRSQFKYGRTTSTACSFSNGRLPNPEASCTAVNTTFIQRIGLNWTTAAALMGVHTLGRAQTTNSGYEGWWGTFSTNNKFDNDYYISILAKGWKTSAKVGGNSAKNQWRRVDVGANSTTLGSEMMLNTDLCLAFTFDSSGTALNAASQQCCSWLNTAGIATGVSSYNNNTMCGITNYATGSLTLRKTSCCGAQPSRDCGDTISPKGPSFKDIVSFSNSESTWLSAFKAAWKIATTNGYSSLKTPTR